MPRTSPEERSSTRLVFLVADLAGFHRCFASRSDAVMVAFLDRFYDLAETVVSGSGGRVIKFMGDALLAVYPADAARSAVASAVTLEVESRRIATDAELPVTLGANLHMGDAILTELGSGASRRLDVIGRAVNHTFILGRGSGIRISEPVFRQLPSGERSPWGKHKPPAVYVLGDDRGLMEGSGQSAGANTMRW